MEIANLANEYCDVEHRQFIHEHLFDMFVTYYTTGGMKWQDGRFSVDKQCPALAGMGQ